MKTFSFYGFSLIPFQTTKMCNWISFSIISFYLLFLVQNVTSDGQDYDLALTKSLLYFEAQRSGPLPYNQRVKWRGDSALNDGKAEGMDLVGGYYDAGDNVKFGLPMAFTVTMLAWAVVESGNKLQDMQELSNALDAIKWGTDYFIKAHPQPNVLYGLVGDGKSDHECWQRPEDMTTPRTAYKIDEIHPGSDLAGETAAAFAAASMAFAISNPTYSSQLITHAKQLFDFADKYQGTYDSSILEVKDFYTSSGYEDELLWAAAWLYHATKEEKYLDYINQMTNVGLTYSFSWDDKYAGAQVLLAKYLVAGKLLSYDNIFGYKTLAENFICNCIGTGINNFNRTAGGLLWFQEFNNLQYVTSASFLISTYAEALFTYGEPLHCPRNGDIEAQELITFIRSQVDYILGSNPKSISYMVGYGDVYPLMVHHRGASIVSIKQNSTQVPCREGFTLWQKRNSPNPNVIEGAIVGGPNLDDSFQDSRDNFYQNAAGTINVAPIVGVLAYLA